MEAARTQDWPRRWDKVGSEPLGKLVESLCPRFVFCGHMHYAAQVQVGHTTLVALDAFSARPDLAYAVLETEPLRLVPIASR
jgi:Icc-related predicted phosphoesterase